MLEFEHGQQPVRLVEQFPAMCQAVQPAIDSPGQPLDIVSVSDAVQLVPVPVEHGRLHRVVARHEVRMFGHLGVSYPFRKRLVVVLARQLDEAPPPISPAVSAALAAIPHPIRIDAVGDLLGPTGIGLGRGRGAVHRGPGGGTAQVRYCGIKTALGTFLFPGAP